MSYRLASINSPEVGLKSPIVPDRLLGPPELLVPKSSHLLNPQFTNEQIALHLVASAREFSALDSQVPPEIRTTHRAADVTRRLGLVFMAYAESIDMDVISRKRDESSTCMFALKFYAALKIAKSGATMHPNPNQEVSRLKAQDMNRLLDFTMAGIDFDKIPPGTPARYSHLFASSLRDRFYRNNYDAQFRQSEEPGDYNPPQPLLPVMPQGYFRITDILSHE